LTQRKFLTRNEIDNLIRAAARGRHPQRDACLLKMCFIHGFRVSELCRLTLADINLEAGIVYVRRLKNGFSTTHPLTPEELPYLRAWLAHRRTLEARSAPWLFLSQKRGPLCRQAVYNLIRRYGAQAGVGVGAHPHMLRHACGFALADLGADTRLIQDYLGHRNINHTVIYTASNAQRFNEIWTRYGHRKLRRQNREE
jgi:type 1 fimbriae regulatory protein FimB